MTQCERVLRHLHEVGPLTGAQAMQEYGIAHLASRISDLRKEGENSHKEMKTSKNRYGERVSYAVYSMEENKGA